MADKAASVQRKTTQSCLPVWVLVSSIAVKTQIWIAISVYVLVAIVKKRLNTEASLYTILQILNLILFGKTPIDQLVKNTDVQITMSKNNNQLNLFN